MKLFKFLISNFVFRICLVFLFSNFVFSIPTFAQSTSLSLSPPVVQILLAPNKKFIQTFLLTNQGESGNFVASLHRLIPIGIEGQTTIDPAPLDLSELPFVPRLENPDLVLDEPFALTSSESKQLVLSLEGSSLSGTEDAYLALVIRQDVTGATTSISKAGISALILVTVSGDSLIPLKLDISGFDLPSFHDSGSPLTLSPVLENQSHIMVRPEGNLKIMTASGKEVYSADIYNNLILSNSKRLIQGRDAQNKPFELVWQPSWFSFGPHTFRLTVETAGKSKILELERVVWLLPIRILLIILLAVIIISLLMILKKRLKRNPTSSNSRSQLPH